MHDLLAHKLDCFMSLSAREKNALGELTWGNARRFGSREDIVCEGDCPQHISVILEGWACRYKQLEDGRRQNLAFLLPGDLSQSHLCTLGEMDHSVGALTPVTLAQIPRETLVDVAERFPRIGQALCRDLLVGASVQREWTVNLGRRVAVERLGHLLCEVFLRLRAVGLTEETSCEFPLTQGDLSDALGLSNVHVNRVLQELRASGLVILRNKRLTLPNLAKLQAASLFSPNYLHLRRDAPDLDENAETSGAHSSGVFTRRAIPSRQVA